MSEQLQSQVKAASTPSFTPVRSGLLQRKCACGNSSGLTGDCAECGEKKMTVQRQSANQAEPSTVPAIVNEVMRSPGQPLDPATRAFMEPRFSHSFSRVRVHTDSQAAESARAVNALAYTVGRDVVFGGGQYAPGTNRGKQLLAHELTHVVQQSGVISDPANLTIGDPNNAYEREAETGQDLLLDQHVDSSVRTPVVQRVSQPVIMRSPLPFSSTLKICHTQLESRDFTVSKGGLIVDIDARWQGPDEGPASCETHSRKPYYVSLSQKGLLFDNDYGTCDFDPKRPNRRKWTGLPLDDYYLTILSGYNTNPNCCLEGTIDVSEQVGLTGESCTQLPDDALTILHTALDVAGLIPFLGAIPDAINAGIYLIEGDWVNAGISAAAIIPIFGEGATLTKLGVKVEQVTVKRLGKEAIEDGLKEAKTGGKKIVREEIEKVDKKLVGEGTENVTKKVVIEGAETALERAARYAKEGTIIPYKEGQKITATLNHAYHAHHILEQRHIKNWLKDYGETAIKQAIEQAPSVILSKKDHDLISDLLFQSLPKKIPHSKAAVWKVYQKVYAEFPGYLKAIEHYFN